MDPDNPVIKLCSEGMQAEAQGKLDAARDLFKQAWAISQDDYEACVAAHYLARHQATPEATLHWNQVALTRAQAVGDERVREFYPSLCLNIGFAYETLGNPVEAKRYYDLAHEKTSDLPAGPYADMVRGGIANGLKRIDSLEVNR